MPNLTQNQRPTYKPYFGSTITVPNDGVYHQIWGLMNTVFSSPNFGIQAPHSTKYFTIQVDKSGTANALIGEGPLDDQGNANPGVVTASNYGVMLGSQGSETFGGFWDEYVNITHFYVINDGTGNGICKLNIQAVRG